MCYNGTMAVSDNLRRKRGWNESDIYNEYNNRKSQAFKEYIYSNVWDLHETIDFNREEWKWKN